jgi:threonine/homoserine/homoserine lactone efflux protein
VVDHDAMLLSFLAVSMLVIATPGPDTTLTIRNTLRGGRRAGVATAAGVALGQVVWAALTAFGLATILAASDVAFTLVKVFGAAYLAYLGLRALHDALRGATPVGTEPGRRAGASLSRRASFQQGLYSNLANPKMAAFFTGLLPQFAPGGRGVALLGLGCVFAVLTLAWLSLYATMVARARRALERPRVRRFLDALTGAALVALAGRLLADRRA